MTERIFLGCLIEKTVSPNSVYIETLKLYALNGEDVEACQSNRDVPERFYYQNISHHHKPITQVILMS